MGTPRSSPNAEPGAGPSAEPFERASDARCLRGLRFVYTTARDASAVRLERELGPGLVVASEPWPGRRVTRLILQFRFEVRIGERDREVVLMHRACTSAEARQADRARFEGALHRSLALASGASLPGEDVP